MAEKKVKKAESVDEKKDKALTDAIHLIEKQFGKGSIMKLGDRVAVDIDVIPTGSLTLDAALGIGGYPKGRIIEIYGPESSGKTTLTLHAIAEVQKQGGRAAFIDAEHAIDPVYAKNLGVDVDELILSQPDSGEQGLAIAETLVKSNAIDLVVVDSVAALVPQVELDGEMGDNSVGLQARMMSKAMRRLSGLMNKTSCTIIFINQLREKIGVMYGNPETTTGGRALNFMLLYVLKSDVVKLLKMVVKLSEIRSILKLLKIRYHHLLKQHQLILFMVKELPEMGKSLIWQWLIILLINLERGMLIKVKRLVKEGKM